MKSGTIYIKQRLSSSDGYTRWKVVNETKYNSVAQRKQLLLTLAKRYGVNDVNTVLSVMPR